MSSSYWIPGPTSTGENSNELNIAESPVNPDLMIHMQESGKWSIVLGEKSYTVWIIPSWRLINSTKRTNTLTNIVAEISSTIVQWIRYVLERSSICRTIIRSRYRRSAVHLRFMSLAWYAQRLKLPKQYCSSNFHGHVGYVEIVSDWVTSSHWREKMTPN